MEGCLFELYKDFKLDYKLKELEEWGGIYYSDVVCEMIVLIYNDKWMDMVVFIENNGIIIDLLYDCVVEVFGFVIVYGYEFYNWGVFLLVVWGII